MINVLNSPTLVNAVGRERSANYDIIGLLHASREVDFFYRRAVQAETTPIPRQLYVVLRKIPHT